jgi:hypothetical protein
MAKLQERFQADDKYLGHVTLFLKGRYVGGATRAELAQQVQQRVK